MRTYFITFLCLWWCAHWCRVLLVLTLWIEFMQNTLFMVVTMNNTCNVMHNSCIHFILLYLRALSIRKSQFYFWSSNCQAHFLWKLFQCTVKCSSLKLFENMSRQIICHCSYWILGDVRHSHVSFFVSFDIKLKFDKLIWVVYFKRWRHIWNITR